jgi:4-amino-4-deoxy-L-arabinose transferase-like glycosyltransferase
LGFIVAAGALRPRNRLARPHQQLLLWAAWLVPQLAFFSFAGLFHRYYLEMLSPAIAALAGAGITALWRNHCGGGLRWLIAPVVFLAAALAQVAMLGHFPAWSHWLTPPILGLTLSGALALIVLRRRRALAAAAMTVCLAALLIAPAVWSLTPIINGGDSGLPFAGPELLERRGRGGIPGRDPLVDFLQANRNGATYLVATLNANAASPIILATGQPVMALGGFGGNDNLVTVDRLARYVADNTVRFFWLPQEGNQQANLVRWVRERCTLMPFGAPPRSSPGNPPQGGGPAYQLYRCAPPR